MLHCKKMLDILPQIASFSHCAAHKSPLSSRRAKEIMAKTESKNGFFDVAKAFGDFRLPGIDVDAIVAAQRKNFEALTQANQFAVEGLRI